jgi:hypothetical protein
MSKLCCFFAAHWVDLGINILAGMLFAFGIWLFRAIRICWEMSKVEGPYQRFNKPSDGRLFKLDQPAVVKVSRKEGMWRFLRPGALRISVTAPEGGLVNGKQLPFTWIADFDFHGGHSAFASFRYVDPPDNRTEFGVYNFILSEGPRLDDQGKPDDKEKRVQLLVVTPYPRESQSYSVHLFQRTK